MPPDIAANLEVDDRLDEAELNLSQQNLNLESAKGEQEVLEKYTISKMTGQLRGEIERAKSDELRKQAILQLEGIKGKKLERQIEKCTLRAPGDGLIVYANDRSRVRNQVQIEEGATVRERQLIFRVVDLKAPMRINVKAREAWVDRLLPGMRARVRVDAMANEVINGQVISIAPMADANNLFNSDIKVYTTFVALEGDTSRLGLRPGMSARVEILVKELDNVLSVPITSVIGIDDKDLVAVKTPGGAIEWRTVELGLSNDKSVEVKKGLQPGDLVILDPASHMSEEMKRKNKYPMKSTRAAAPAIP